MDNCDPSVADPKKQYKILKRLTKELVIENACLCDTVDLLGKRLYILEQERKFLLKRLLQKKQMKSFSFKRNRSWNCYYKLLQENRIVESEAKIRNISSAEIIQKSLKALASIRKGNIYVLLINMEKPKSLEISAFINFD